jgi:hypothetical protein
VTFPDAGAALYTALAGGSALMSEVGGTTHIYEAVAPQGTAFPLPHLIYFRAGGGDDNETQRRTRSEQWVVKGVSTDQTQARRIDALIDARLHEQELTITGWDNYQTARRTDVAYAEPGEGGVVYWHRGGAYRLNIGES